MFGKSLAKHIIYMGYEEIPGTKIFRGERDRLTEKLNEIEDMESSSSSLPRVVAVLLALLLCCSLACPAAAGQGNSNSTFDSYSISSFP
jgi:hypothetical protein